jgi:hypothetical protein
VLNTVAPAACQRSTTSARGMPQRLPKPADTNAARGATARTKSVLEELALP